MSIGSRLKSLRKEKHLTQKQVADRIGVAVNTVSAYESDARYPPYDILLKLARMFHVSADYLLGLCENRTIDVTGLSEEEVNVVTQLINLMRNK